MPAKRRVKKRKGKKKVKKPVVENSSSSESEDDRSLSIGGDSESDEDRSLSIGGDTDEEEEEMESKRDGKRKHRKHGHGKGKKNKSRYGYYDEEEDDQDYDSMEETDESEIEKRVRSAMHRRRPSTVSTVATDSDIHDLFAASGEMREFPDIVANDKLCEKLKKKGDPLKVIECLELGLLLRKEHYGIDSSQVSNACEELSTSCNALAMHFLGHDESEIAINLLKKAEILTEAHGYFHNNASRLKVRAITFNNFGCLYKRTGKLRIALKYLDKALQIELNAPDVHSPASTHLNLCAILSQLDKHESAMEHAQCALDILKLEIKRDLFDAGSDRSAPDYNNASILAIAYHNLAVEQEFLQRLEDADKSYRRSLTVAIQQLGKDHPVALQIKDSQQKCAKLLKKANKKRQARETKREANSVSNYMYGGKKRPKSAFARSGKRPSTASSMGRPKSKTGKRRPVSSTATGRRYTSSSTTTTLSSSRYNERGRKPPVPTRPRSAMARSGRSNNNARRRPQSAVARMTSDSEPDDFSYLRGGHRPSSSQRGRGRSSALASGGRKARLANSFSNDTLTDYLDEDDFYDDEDEWVDLLDDDDQEDYRHEYDGYGQRIKRKPVKKTGKKRKGSAKKRSMAGNVSGGDGTYTVTTNAPNPFVDMGRGGPGAGPGAGQGSHHRNRPSHGEYTYDDPMLMQAHQYQQMMHGMYGGYPQPDPYAMMYAQAPMHQYGMMYGDPYQQQGYYGPQQPMYSENESFAPPPPSSPQTSDVNEETQDDQHQQQQGQEGEETQQQHPGQSSSSSSTTKHDQQGQESNHFVHDVSPQRQMYGGPHHGSEMYHHGQASMGMMGMGGMGGMGMGGGMMEDPYMAQYGMGMGMGMGGQQHPYGGGYMHPGGYDEYGPSGFDSYGQQQQFQQHPMHQSLQDGYSWAPVPPEVHQMMDQQQYQQHHHHHHHQHQEPQFGDEHDAMSPVKHPQIAALQEEDFGGSPVSSGTPMNSTLDSSFGNDSVDSIESVEPQHEEGNVGDQSIEV